MGRTKQYPRLVIAGTQSGVGKTTITLGIIAALKKRGLSIQPYKVGPDYIDTAFHSAVAGRACSNLDSYLLEPAVVGELFQRRADAVDCSIIEGVMGLFDGAGVDGVRGSTADVAKILSAPVILVVDARKMAHSAAAMVLGYVKHTPSVRIAGCIVNNIASENHYAIVKNAIERTAKVPVFGYLPKDAAISLPERHLGLRPVQESSMRAFIRTMANRIAKTVDLDALLRVAHNDTALPRVMPVTFMPHQPEKKVRIGYAYDTCFHFYYQDNLDILRHYGAALVPFSPLRDTCLPRDIKGLYIGGGFPEVFAPELSRNKALRREIALASQNGMPIYAECGGLMYLMKELVLRDKARHPLCGVFPGTVKMGRRLQTFGYHAVSVRDDMLFAPAGAELKGHVFHWSYVTGMPKRVQRVFSLSRGDKTVLDGYARKRTVASYVHIHFASNVAWAKQFIETCSEY